VGHSVETMMEIMNNHTNIATYKQSHFRRISTDMQIINLICKSKTALNLKIPSLDHLVRVQDLILSRMVNDRNSKLLLDLISSHPYYSRNSKK
jgi:hypothetical protein